MALKPDLKSIIETAIQDLQKKKEMDKDAGALLASLEQGLVKAVTPALEKAVGSMHEGMMKNMKGIKMEAPKIDMPSMEMDLTPVSEAIKSAITDSFKGIKINVPEVKLPTINVPELKMPTINVPPQTINEVALKGVSAKNPVPVTLFGTDGNPIMSFGGGGNRSNLVAIKNILTANGDSVLDDTNDAIRVNLVAGTVTTTPGLQVSGAADSVNVIQFGGVDAALNAGVTNSGTLRVVHATDVAMSVNIVGGSSAGTQYTEGDDPTAGTAVGTLMMAEDEDFIWPLQFGAGRDSLALRVVHASNVAMSVEISSQPFTFDTKQVSGGIDSVSIASLPFTLDVKQVSGDVSSVSLVSQSATLDVRQVSGASDSVNILSSVTLDIKQLSGSSNSVNIASQGITLETRQVSGASHSVQMQGLAMTTNPTAVSDGAVANVKTDKIGRHVMVPIQVRQLCSTAYATLSTNTETSLLAGGGSGVFHDLVYIKFSNTSSGAVTIDLRDTTAGGIVDTYEVPANGVVGVAPTAPIPQSEGGSSWTVDYNDSDLSNTTVYVSGLFAKNT